MVDLMPRCPVGQMVTSGAKSPVSRLPCSEVATANIPKSMRWEYYGARLKGMSCMDSLSSPCMFPGIIWDCKLSSLDSLRRCDSAAAQPLLQLVTGLGLQAAITSEIIQTENENVLLNFLHPEKSHSLDVYAVSAVKTVSFVTELTVSQDFLNQK